jgi:hypothetical protein
MQSGVCTPGECTQRLAALLLQGSLHSLLHYCCWVRCTLCCTAPRTSTVTDSNRCLLRLSHLLAQTCRHRPVHTPCHHRMHLHIGAPWGPGPVCVVGGGDWEGETCGREGVVREGQDAHRALGSGAQFCPCAYLVANAFIQLQAESLFHTPSRPTAHLCPDSAYVEVWGVLCLHGLASVTPPHQVDCVNCTPRCTPQA